MPKPRPRDLLVCARIAAAAVLSLCCVSEAAAQSTWSSQPVASTTMTAGSQTYTDLYVQSYSSPAVPVCAAPSSAMVSTSPCTAAQIAAGDVTEASVATVPLSSRTPLTLIPAAAVAPASQAVINVQDEYPDSASPTGVSYINANIPLSAFATAASVSSETSRAEGAEATLATNLSTETSRAQGAETTLATSISNETSRAESAEATLANGITQESNRAQAAETNLGAQIQAESQARIADVSRVTKGYRDATATAVALGGVGFLPGKRLNLTVNMGTYEGQWAVAAQAAIAVNDHAMFNAGVATSVNGSGTGARAGLTVGW